MIEFKVVTARQGRNGEPDKAVVCADFATGWVADNLIKTHRLVRELPVEAHWSARVVLNEAEPDTAQEGWLGPEAGMK